MGNGDPVTQEKFYDTMNSTKKEIVDAIEKVNDNVQETNTKVAVVETKLDTHETRMSGIENEVKDQKNINKNWNRGLATAQALLGTVLVGLGITRE